MIPVLLDDLPTLDDKLGWDREIQRLKVRVEKCPTPHVLGIHGDWGAGKTSFMRQLQHSLGGEAEAGVVRQQAIHAIPDENNSVVTIWFDAWRYQHESSPIVALLQEMRRQFSTMKKVKEKFEKLSTVALQYTLDGLAGIGKAIGYEAIPNSEKIRGLGEAWEKSNFHQVGQFDSLRKHLHDTIVALLPNGVDTRVVVFIDDLDRCNAKSAFKLLEGLKIYLSLPNCVFILGMNENILIDAVREEISAPANASGGDVYLRASHYLEKICTDIYRLPLPRTGSEFFSKMLMDGSADSNPAQAFVLAVGDTICLPPNLRRLKALANQWKRFSGCVLIPEDVEDQKVWAVRVLVASYIHQFHRDLWERWHFDADFWNECVAWCCGERSHNADGVAMIPVWAAALKLTSKTQVGDSGVRPAWAVQYPNPGDINLFWIDELIREYRDHLLSVDFRPLLEGHQAALEV
ncbi:P-loop NTPase fold protein [Pseudomonas sp. W22_MBD1_FP4]|uniref:KAP family P-loop NTPase fold protein n=1 Tax=Pseudomonas sp. W22_MBD1_FP4 TaxID=3240272 RepID=UPI003F9B4832